MKRMLINATHAEELRVALVDGQKLYDLDIEVPAREQKKSNVYKGIITRVERSLEAVFVDYGSERHGFLPFKEITGLAIGLDTPEIKDKGNIKEGLEIVVQVEKEERGNKGAALTTQISLAGSYLVLMPNNPGSGGISRRIDGENRVALKEAMDQLDIPESIGLIVRTAGVGKSVEELQWDLNYLTHLWDAISLASKDRKAPYLIFQESNFVIRSIRDYLRADIDEVLIDSPASFNLARDFMQQIMPQYLSRVKLYEESVPLFTRYQIESQIEVAYGREVPLPSGGSIVIDPTEALTSIDINSARATKGADFETTALNINLEAADEVARQLRIRDMGGLFVIDFIDMGPTKNQRMVENRIKEAMKHDRARIQFSRISRFGLLEMSRQRIHSSLTESSLPVCPRCHGQGTIRSVESLSLSVIRILEEEAMKDHTARVIVQLPIDCATFVLNEKRSEIQQIEKTHNVTLVIVPNKHLETPHYEIERVRTKEVKEDKDASHERVPHVESREFKQYQREPEKQQKAVVKNVMPPTPQPKPVVVEPESGGFLKRFFGKLISGSTKEEPKKEERKPSNSNRRKQNQPRSKQGENRNRNSNQNRNRNRNRNQANAKNDGQKKPVQQPAEKPVNKVVDSTTTNEGAPKPARKRRRNRRSSSKSESGQNQSTPQAQSAQPTAAKDGNTAAKPRSEGSQNQPATQTQSGQSTAAKDGNKGAQPVESNKALQPVATEKPATVTTQAQAPTVKEKPKQQQKAPSENKAVKTERPATDSHTQAAEKEKAPSTRSQGVRHPRRRRRNSEAKPNVSEASKSSENNSSQAAVVSQEKPAKPAVPSQVKPAKPAAPSQAKPAKPAATSQEKPAKAATSPQVKPAKEAASSQENQAKPVVTSQEKTTKSVVTPVTEKVIQKPVQKPATVKPTQVSDES